MTSVSATDAVFEDLVEITWSGAVGASSVVRIERDAEVIGVVASDVKIFNDTAAEPRVSYQYCVIVTASDGSNSTPVCDNGTRGFFAPTGMTASDRLFEGHVLLTWTDRSQRETEYRVIRRLASETQFGGLVTLPANASSYRDTMAVVGAEYRYGVAAHDADGFRSVFAFDNGERAAVTPPADVSASDGQYPNFVRITWSDQSDQEDAFVVYRNGANIGTVSENTTLFDDASATTAVTYSYCVASIVGGVESVQVCDDGMRGGLRAPANVAATDDTFDDRVSITWNDDADTEDGFEVYRRLLTSPDSVLLATRPVNATSYHDRAALQGVDYRYCVRAFSNSDPSAASFSASVCDNGRRSDVLAPEDVVASDETFEDRVEISWTNPSTTVTLFKLYRDGALIQTLPSNLTSFVDVAIASDVEHTYEVSAVTVVATSAEAQQAIEEEVAVVFARAANENVQRQIAVAQEVALEPTVDEIATQADRIYSEIEQIVQSYASSTSAEASAAGTIVESARVSDTGSRSLNIPGSVEATFDEFEDRVDVTWVDNSAVERGYRVYRQAGGAAEELVGEVSASRASLGDYAGVPGVTYTYHVRAFDDRGPGGESQAGSDTGRRILEAPTQLRAQDGRMETEILLTWNDNSRAETAYRVRRSDGKVDTLLAAQSNRFTDTVELVIGKAYEYTVTASDDFGASSAASDSGSTAILSPTAVNASDVYTDKVRIVWEDRSMVNDGYRIRRTSAADFFELTTSESVFTDIPGARPLATNTDYTYCVAAFADDPASSDRFYSQEVCDTGRRPGVEDDGGPDPVGPQVITGGGAGFEFGRSVAVYSEDTLNVAAIGAPGSANLGQAFLYDRASDGTWSLDQELVLIDGAGVERRREYGFAVDVSANFAIVGDPQSRANGDGRVSVFNLAAGTTENYVAGNDASIGSVDADNWGWAVALDGNAALAGSPRARAREQDNRYTGIALADCDVTTFNIPGSANNWLQHRPNVSLGNNAEFGYSLDVAGNYAIVGAPGEGSTFSMEGGGNAYIFLQTDNPCGFSLGSWDLQLSLFGFDISRSGERAGEGVAISDDFALVGAPGAGNGGLVYAYRRSDSNWLPIGTLEANRTTTGFGKTIAIYQTDDLVEALVGAPDESGGKGAVYAYRWDPIFENWDGPTRYDASVASLTPTDADEFGTSVAIGNGYYMVGAPGTDQPSADAGAVVIIPFDFTPVVLPSALNPPGDVAATDGTSDDRIQLTWKDLTDAEEGYRIYRSAAGGGLEVYDEVDVNVEVYNDVDAAAGAAYEYCVAAIDGDSESLRTCDVGWRPPNGVIGGRVAARSGGGTEDVTVCPDPNPNQALLFDGEGGFVETVFANQLRLDSFTILLWFRTASSADQKLLSSDTDLHPLEITGGKLQTCIDGCTSGTTDVNDGSWHSAAIIGDATNIRVYLDGSLEITHAPAGGQTQIMSGVLQLGKDADADASFFSGAMDELQIWNVTRTVAQIGVDRTRSQSGDEDGLLAYWPMDQGARNAAPEITSTAGHGLLQGGVYWTGESAPLDVCTTTDFEGNYELTNLRYGTSGSFTITPSRDQRSFDPGFATVTLSSESPVQNKVDFIDQTVYTISGLVTFEGGECPVPDVEMYLDGGLRGNSEVDGTYGVSSSPSTDGADLRLLEPRLASTQDAGDFHVFVPSDTLLFVEDDVPNVNFVSTKTRTLSGYFGGSCGIDIGSATLRIYTENGCFERQIAVQGDYTASLPPQAYLVEVVDVQTTNDQLRADIIDFYDNLGAQVVDLTIADDTLDLTYHAPLSVEIAGLDNSDASSCTESTFRFVGNGGVSRDLPRVPLLRQPGNRVEPIVLSISATENFGGGLLCPVEDATVTVFDEINDQDSGVELTTNIDGVAVYTEDQPDLPDESPGPKAGDPYETYANTPSVFQGRTVDGIDRSFQKSITAVVDVTNREAVTETAWAIVTGSLPRAGTFTTLPTTNVPLHVLRDPPGDGSSSFLDEGNTVCNSVSLSGFVAGAAGKKIKVDAGLTFAAGFISLYTDNKVKGKLEKESVLSAKAQAGVGWDICATLGERISTSGSPNFIGDDADVFLGAGTNFLFAVSDELGETNSCELGLSEALRVGLNPDKTFETIYAYSQAHIVNTIVPQLEDLSELDAENANQLLDARDNWTAQLDYNRIEKHVAFGDCEKLDPESLRLQCNDFDAARQFAIDRLRDELITDQEAECDERFQTSIDRGLCRQNVREAAAAVTLPQPTNRSFDAGSIYSYSHSKSTTRTFSADVDLDFTQNWKVAFETEVAGSGPEFEAQLSVKLGGSFGWKRARTNQHTVGYVLQDNDLGDSFTVDVVDDIAFTTPIFRLRSGRSSNPWEAGTQPRDRAQIAINPPVLNDVAPNDPAVFTVSLTNAGDSKETREYILRTVHTANPGGAILSANGAPIHAGLSFFIGPDQTQEVTLAARRGPNRYQYEGLEVQLYPAGEYPIWADGGLNGNGIIQLADTARFDVFFNAPCSDIAILRPKENWSLNAATIPDGLEIILNQFRIGVSETDSVAILGVEYRVAGDETPRRWPLEFSVATSELASDATSWSSVWQPNPALRNGLYEMRAFTECAEAGSGARVYSDVITGIVDTKPPLVFGAPEPGDEILALGDDIAITFDEAMECGSIDTEGVGKNTTLTYVDGPNAGTEIPITPVCDGRTLVLVPDSGYDWTQAENRLLQVDLLTGVVDGQSNPSVASDLAGNPIGDPIAWQFTVQRSAFAWSPANLTVNILSDTELEASLVNGRAQEVAYTLGNVPSWLSPSVASGSLPPGGTETIGFEVDATQLTPGTRDTLAAETAAGDALLFLQAVCELEAWTIDPARFQYSMTVTGQLFIDGSVSDDTNDRIAAFVGSELRGVANVSDVSAGSNRANLTVYSNNPSGETVTMRVFDASACHVFAGTDRTFTFVAGSGLGTPEQPVAINATDELAQQAISLAAGWTWFSLNREPGSAVVSDVLSTVLGRAGDVVKSQTAFNVYDQGLGSWVGSLNSIEPGHTYLIKTANANTLVLGGPPVDPAAAPVDLVAGWNWIGYLPQVSMTVDEALASLAPTATTNDLIKSQYQFAQYDGSSWVGSLTQMDPGLGYLLKADAAGSILYPSTSAQIASTSDGAGRPIDGTSLAKEPATQYAGIDRMPTKAQAEDDAGHSTSAGIRGMKPQQARATENTDGGIPLWQVAPDKYAHSMTVTAEVQIDGAASAGSPLFVAAYVGDEVRGVVRTRSVGTGDRELVFLMVYSDEPKGEPVTFRVYDAADERTYDANENVVFKADAIHGSPLEPHVLTVGAVATKTSTAEELPTEFALKQNYPNPFNPVTTIRYELPKASNVQITLFDVLGREVRRLLDADRKAGRYDLVVDASTLASGMYVYSIKAGAFRDLRKMMVVK